MIMWQGDVFCHGNASEVLWHAWTSTAEAEMSMPCLMTFDGLGVKDWHQNHQIPSKLIKFLMFGGLWWILTALMEKSFPSNSPNPIKTHQIFFSAINVWWPLMDFDGFDGEKISVKLTKSHQNSSFFFRPLMFDGLWWILTALVEKSFPSNSPNPTQS